MTNRTIAVSFIVPIYNTQQYLDQCLQSIINQPIDKEIILINDGSTDDSLQIALDYCEKYDNITLVHLPKNRGQSGARNQGILLAKGEYIYFVDSDDYLLQDCFNYVLPLAMQERIDIVKFQAKRVFENQHKPDEYILATYPKLKAGHGVYMSGFECLQYAAASWMPAICWTMIRRKFLLDNQILFQEEVRAEDQLFYVQLLTCQLSSRVLEVAQLSYHYRMRAHSTTSKPTKQYFLDHLTICRYIQQWIADKNLPDQVIDALHIVMARIYQSAGGIAIKHPDLGIDVHQYFNDEQVQYITHHLERAVQMSAKLRSPSLP